MSAKLQKFLVQEQVLQAIRQFFLTRQFHEVTPAILNQSLPAEPTIYPFQTDWQTQAGTQSIYLSTSPEKSLKAALAVGLAPCFALGKSFRNLEQAGSQHQPEFLMLEWYRSGVTTAEIKIDVQELFLSVKHNLDHWRQRPATDTLVYQGQTINLNHWKTISLEKLCQDILGIPLADLVTDEAMQQLAHRLGYDTSNATWEQLFNQCFLNELAPTLSAQSTFLTDFPARISPLCAIQVDKPYLADRFEVYIAGMELGNGNAEKTDVTQLRQVFQTENELREQSNLAIAPIDEGFLADAAQMTNQKYAGIGVGVERLMMLLTDAAEIQAVMPLPIL